MIKNFLIINCTGNNDCIGLKINNKYFIRKLQTKLNQSDILVQQIQSIIQKNQVKIDHSFSVIINVGPGSFAGIRTSIAIAKGLQLAKKVKIYSYNFFLLNLANFLESKKKLISIQKTRNDYYYIELNFNKTFTFSEPKKINIDKIIKWNKTVIVPNEVKYDEIFKKIDKKKIINVQFNLKNIDKLIKNNLLQNKLIKPLYLS
jgi:tRNA A37 threonylcarbamoyladenosine modification protein TsaB